MGEDPRGTDTERNLPLSSSLSLGYVKGKEGVHKGGYDFKGGAFRISLVVPVQYKYLCVA